MSFREIIRCQVAKNRCDGESRPRLWVVEFIILDILVLGIMLVKRVSPNSPLAKMTRNYRGELATGENRSYGFGDRRLLSYA